MASGTSSQDQVFAFKTVRVAADCFFFFNVAVSLSSLCLLLNGKPAKCVYGRMKLWPLDSILECNLSAAQGEVGINKQSLFALVCNSLSGEKKIKKTTEKFRRKFLVKATCPSVWTTSQSCNLF